ncbi:hypothetical protein MHC_04515 [Mycoplasma haemocanis str. Illinois]|uniref:Uncharacterized protein n=1 Tax=Mycoplasma haemocanis (strain Illinois) TaxID=1111676 RepID=H6N7Y7_MYCHN|nr:hypothetical protein [Mycoplasma haemocanis]AEW45759.1 hypothetical protein MHC_04515 [Mycoplasma haemocanis str. Illinois]
MSLALKIPVFAAGVTASAGLGVLAINGFSLKSEESISSLLSKDLSKRLIASDEIDYWNQSWNRYKSNSDIWNLKKSDSSLPDIFKVTCKNKLESKVSGKDSQAYKDFLNYCARDTLVSDLIRERAPNKELLTKGNGSEDHWVSVWKLYVNDSRNSKEAKGDHIWKLSDWDSSYSSESKASSGFMDACVANVKKPYVEGSFYEDTLKFCTKDKASSG